MIDDDLPRVSDAHCRLCGAHGLLLLLEKLIQQRIVQELRCPRCRCEQQRPEPSWHAMMNASRPPGGGVWIGSDLQRAEPFDLRSQLRRHVAEAPIFVDCDGVVWVSAKIARPELSPAVFVPTEYLVVLTGDSDFRAWARRFREAAIRIRKEVSR